MRPVITYPTSPAVSDSTGTVACSIASVNQSPGPIPVTDTFGGDQYYKTASASSTVNLPEGTKLVINPTTGTYSGPTTLLNGTLQLAGAGTLLNTSLLDIRGGGLTLNNSDDNAAADNTITPADVTRNAATIANVRLWDPSKSITGQIKAAETLAHIFDVKITRTADLDRELKGKTEEEVDYVINRVAETVTSLRELAFEARESKLEKK